MKSSTTIGKPGPKEEERLRISGGIIDPLKMKITQALIKKTIDNKIKVSMVEAKATGKSEISLNKKRMRRVE